MRVARSLAALLFGLICLAPTSAHSAVPLSEREALLALYSSTNGANWKLNTNWGGAPGTECTWHGVQCSEDGTTVEALNFYDNNLSGPFPTAVAELRNLKSIQMQRNSLTGSIPSELGQLSHLKSLDICWNKLTGGIPEALSDLPELDTLIICGNQLTGPIPASWKKLQKLAFVSASINRLSGPIPPDLGSLPNLWRLYINTNDLTGPIPPELGNLSNLEELSIGHGNELTGSIPIELTNLKKLRILYLGSGNYLSGPIPPELGTLTNLTEFDLSSCRFTGPIPASIGNLTNLKRLRLSYNQLTGSIPPELGNLQNLELLDVSGNPLEGTIPAELGNLRSLTDLRIYWTSVGGDIPSSLGNLTGLTQLELSSNRLSGPIPAELGELASLQMLDLSGNLLTGALPSTLGNLANLYSVDLSFNGLTGEVPGSFASLTKLNSESESPPGLVLSYNGLYASSDSLRTFLDGKHPGVASFETLQTLAPTGLSATATSPSSIRLDWTPIAYQWGLGGYRIESAPSQGGPFSLVALTPNKAAKSAEVTGLRPGSTYYFRASAVTFASGSQQNTIISDTSPVVSATTTQSVPSVVLVDSPETISAPADGSSTATAWYTLSNVGQASTLIELSQSGTFFTQSPASFTLAAGSTQRVTLTSLPQTAAGALRGTSIPSGAGVPSSLVVPVTLLVATPPATGTPEVVVVTRRVDVAAPAGTNPSGSVTFRNVGTAAATGLLAADVPWIVPDPALLVIAPGAEISASFTIDRARRPDAAAPAGTLAATLSFVYVIGTPGARRAPNAGLPTLAAPVTVGDTVKPPVAPGGIPPLADGELGLVIPGVGNVTGSVGVFVSDLSIGNALSGLAASDLKLYYTSGASTLAATQPVAAGSSLSLADVVSTVFDKTEQVGTLHLRSSMLAQLSVNANVFNKSGAEGTWGTAIPVFRTDRSVGKAKTIVLTGLRKSATSHTNIYLQEAIGTAASVDITFLATGGESLGTLDNVSVPPFGMTVIGQAFVPEGCVTALVSNDGDGRLLAFATPVDRASGDTWAVADWNVVFGRGGTEPQVVPVAGSAPGRNATYFRTDLAIANGGTAAATATLRYCQQAPAAEIVDVQLSVPPKATLQLDDVVVGFFGKTAPSLGHIELVPASGRLTMTSRTYTTVEGTPRTFGTGVPVMTRSDSLRLGQAKVMGGLRDSTAATIAAGRPGTFRTNVGLVETEGRSATVRVSVLFFDGRTLASGGSTASKTYTLGPHEFRQLNSIAAEIVGAARETEFGELDNIQVRVEVTEGDGGVMVYASATDNGSGDTLLRME